MLTACRRSRGELRGDRGLARPCRAHDERARAFLDAAAQQRIELRDAAGQLRARSSVCRCSEATSLGKILRPPLSDDVVVIPAAKLHAPVLDDAETAALGAVLGIQLLEQHHAVRDALHLQVAIDRGQVVEEDDGAVPGREELLQCEDLPPIAERAAGEEPQLRERVEDDTCRLQPRHVAENQLRDRRQLDFRRVKHRVLLVEREFIFRRRELPDGDAVEHPAMRLGARAELLFGFRERDVENRLAPAARLPS